MKTKNYSNRNNSTRVICQNCGAEVIIPNNEHHIAGIAIGKDSGLGTVVLPTVGGLSTAKDRTTTPPAITAEMLKANPDLLVALKAAMDEIEEGGYIEVDNIVARWTPSMFLRMFYSEDGFHATIKRSIYNYGWKVLVNELNRQAKFSQKGDHEGFTGRNRFYNKNVAFDMAWEYIDAIKEHMDLLKNGRGSKKGKVFCQGRQYIKVRCSQWNGGKGIFVNEMSTFINWLEDKAKAIRVASTPGAAAKAADAFFDTIRSIRWRPAQPSTAFINAYKAAGAYYTMKDLILFEGCKMKVDGNDDTYRPCWRKDDRKFVETETSLKALDKAVERVVNEGVSQNGYQLLGLAKDFLEYNNFDFAATTQKWADQSKVRKSFREANKNRRPRN